MTAAGKSQAFVNERQVPVYVLSRLASHLVDIHGQHENQTLLAPGAALTILDHLDPGLPPLLEKYQEKFVAYDKARETVKKWLLKDAHQTEDLERLEGEIQEIDEARIQPGEDEKLRETVRKLSNQEKILQAVGEAHHYLEGGEDSLPSALDAINTARSALEGVLDYAPELKTYADSMDSAWETLEDVRQSLGDILAADHEDRETLEAAQERLDQLYRLKQKYGGSLEEVLAYRDRAQTEYEGLLSLESTLSRLRKQEAILKAEMQTEADKLTAARKKAAARLVEALLPHIRDLAMPEGRVDLQFTRLPECHGRGQDNVQFLFSANAGMDLKPLGRIASGGELSRFALALKTVMMKKFGVPTMIFDEIDTGVGGVTAEKMAEQMALIARERQVLCITHLAQIACFADQHLYIRKKTVEGSTLSQVAALDEEGRIQEIMRMTGGTNTSRSARENARELLAMAAKFKKTKESCVHENPA